MAGLSALSGPLHGGMARRVLGLMREAQAAGIAAAVSKRLAAGAGVPGFGHPLYPDGDPRARSLLAGFEAPAAYAEARAVIVRLTGAEPNIDFALTALAAHLQLDEDVPFQIFAAARATGWLAHALEQNETGRLIRPRARYTGPTPG